MSEYRHGRVSRPRRPWYARALRLRHLYLSNVWCVVLFEGSIALAVLMALTELVSWWVVLLLPLGVAGMVKLNDLIAGTLERHGLAGSESSRSGGRAWRNTDTPDATVP